MLNTNSEVGERVYAMDGQLLGKCGFYCGSCPTFLSGSCLGCVKAHQQGDCFTRDCVLGRGLPFCGACPVFPCGTLFVKERSTVLDKDWLRWKRGCREDIRIIPVTEENAADAGNIHAESWQESHRSFCTEEFVRRHSREAQTEYLRREMAEGKKVFLLLAPEPVGVVSVQGSLIENLYILPKEQNKGYGSRLLRFAMAICEGTPELWILENNEGARRLYRRFGFRETGKSNPLSSTLREIQMKLADSMGEL